MLNIWGLQSSGMWYVSSLVDRHQHYSSTMGLAAPGFSEALTYFRQIACCHIQEDIFMLTAVRTSQEPDECHDVCFVPVVSSTQNGSSSPATPFSLRAAPDVRPCTAHLPGLHGAQWYAPAHLVTWFVQYCPEYMFPESDARTCMHVLVLSTFAWMGMLPIHISEVPSSNLNWNTSYPD
jgi:hypothetical protein